MHTEISMKIENINQNCKYNLEQFIMKNMKLIFNYLRDAKFIRKDFK